MLHMWGGGYPYGSGIHKVPLHPYGESNELCIRDTVYLLCGHALVPHVCTCDKRFVVFVKVMKKNKRERDEDSVRHGDQYDTQLLWFLMRHMRNRRPQRVSSQTQH